MIINPESREVRSYLALIVVIGGGVLLYLGDQALQLATSNLVTMVLTFYFGSSQSGKEQRATIDRMVEANATTATALAANVPPVTTPVQVEVVNPEPVDVKVVKP